MYSRSCAAAQRVTEIGTANPRPSRAIWRIRAHAGDESLDPLIDRTERVLAQHGSLGLVVELEMDPVDGEVAPLLLGPADELTAQLRPGGLWRDRLGLEDVQVPDDALYGTSAL